MDLPCLVDYLGGGGCELVPFRYASARSSELVEAASLTFHRAAILAPGMSGLASLIITCLAGNATCGHDPSTNIESTLHSGCSAAKLRPLLSGKVGLLRPVHD